MAIDGGKPTRTRPFPTWPRFGPEDAEVAGKVLLSGRVSYWTGEQGKAFESEFAHWAGSSHAVAVANGTVALELALRALDVGPGDEVIVPSVTFIATASAVVARGARPVVVDVDRDSQALTVATVTPAITSRTVAVIAVHVGGYPADGAALAAMAQARGLHLVEDCAQAHGARRDGRPVGSFGRVAAWSFCQDKIMTTAGEGGAITTNDSQLWRRCWELKDHGKSHAAVFDRAHPPGFKWLHHSFGTNARMTEVQAAVGRLQLAKLPAWVARRRRHAEQLRQALGESSVLRFPRVGDGIEPAYYHLYGHILPERLGAGWSRDRIVAAILAEGVACAFGGCTEIYRERAFDAVGRPATALPVGQWLGQRSIVLPVHPALSSADVRDVALAARKVLEEAAA